MKKFFQGIDKKWKEYALAGCVCILFYIIIANLGAFGTGIAVFFRILRPVTIGFIIAYIVNPLANFFKDKVFNKVSKPKLKWVLSVIVTLVIVLLIVTLLIISLIPQIVDSIASLADNYPTYVESLKNFIDNSDNPLLQIPAVTSFIDMISTESGVLDKVGEILRNNASIIIEKSTVVGTAALNTFIGIIVAIYFLAAKSNIAAEFSKAFELMLSPLKFYRLKMLLEKFNNIFSKYIVCEILDSLIVGVLNYIFMIICGMPNALFISVIVAVTNLAPTFGPVIGAVLGTFVLLLVKPTAILAFLIFTFVLQTCDGYIIKPKLFGGALNVSGVLILVSIIVFSKLMGIPGMLLSIPIAAVIDYVYKEAFIPWLELKKDMKQYKKEEAEKAEDNQ